MALNDEVRDEFVAQDIDNLKVTAAVQNQVDAILLQLQKDMKEAMLAVNPWDKPTPASRARAENRLKLRVDDMVTAAYSKIAVLQRASAARLAAAESEQSAMTIRDAIP